jgi:hypothetical protein
VSQADAQAPSPEPVKPQSFKSRYKLQGMMAAVVLMWLDFAYIYHGLVTSDPGTLSAGMVVMFGAAATAYYFG